MKNYRNVYLKKNVLTQLYQEDIKHLEPGKKPKLSDEYDDESIPRIKIGWRPFGIDKWYMVFDYNS